jgi:Lrp/AsnC family transcriptional regulator
VADMQAYDVFYKRLIAAIPLKNVTSRFAMERVKATTVLPLPAEAVGENPRSAISRQPVDGKSARPPAEALSL